MKQAERLLTELRTILAMDKEAYRCTSACILPCLRLFRHLQENLVRHPHLWHMPGDAVMPWTCRLWCSIATVVVEGSLLDGSFRSASFQCM